MIAGNDQRLDARRPGHGHGFANPGPDPVGEGEHAQRQPSLAVEAARQEKQPLARFGAALHEISPGVALSGR